MNEEIAKYLAQLFYEMPTISKSGGLTYAVDGVPVTQFALADSEDCAAHKDKMMVPASKQTGLFYSEEHRPAKLKEIFGSVNVYEGSLKLIFWFNLSKMTELNAAIGDMAVGDDFVVNARNGIVELSAQVFAKLPNRQIAISDNLRTVKLTLSGQLIGNPFEKYNYKDDTYLVHPYVFVSYELKYVAAVKKGCYSPVTLVPSTC